MKYSEFFSSVINTDRSVNHKLRYLKVPNIIRKIYLAPMITNFQDTKKEPNSRRCMWDSSYLLLICCMFVIMSKRWRFVEVFLAIRHLF